MKRIPQGTFERIVDPLALWRSFRKVRRTKRRGITMANYEINADRDLFDLHRALTNGRYEPCLWSLRIVKDPKTRLIAAPAVRDRILHRALLDEIGPWYEKRFMDCSYTGQVGQGTHHALMKALQQHRCYTYRLHLDISRYFPSISHPVLEDLLFRKLRDVRTRQLISKILISGSRVYKSKMARTVTGIDHPPEQTGLPLGSYFSQWCGNFYLDGLDHYVKRELKIKGYIRYMDDFLLFADSRETLAQARAAIADWLREMRRLELNPRYGSIEPCRHPMVFLGYRVSRSGVVPSRRLRRRMKIKIRQAAARGTKPLHQCLQSYRGLLLF